MERWDLFVKSGAAAAGGAASFLFGEWSGLLTALMFAVAIDYVTGVMAAGAEGKLRSSVGLKGIARKVYIFFVVAIAYQVDTVLGSGHTLRDASIWFYLANELLSVLENGGRLGVPLPPVIKQAVEVLKSKGGVSDDHRN
ncbi:holin [Paenibacillus dendritiformis]|uniref:phage holin family protein n=1 Tax=Paenibacillus TaxID=44249 RepID=UPI001B1FEACC|nr:phage holin family protein [Paenibacillus dendritiformis]GIO81643.1 holin [Paenibacillus dendritiformis]